MNYDKSEFFDELVDYRKSISEAIEHTNNSEYMSLNEDLIEIQSAIDTLVYKLKMY